MWRNAVREYSLWREYPLARMLWLIRQRNNPLRRKTYQIGDVEYSYFIHPYNQTWRNERAVELQVIKRILALSNPAATLEVGNVTSHYFESGHTVIDKHETCRYRPVINEDLLYYEPHQRFALIVSISTIEHMGWDESPRDESKVMAALEKLQSMLALGGKVVITFPVGYNHFLDSNVHRLVDRGATIQCLKRVSADNQWVETDLEDALRCKYGSPFVAANALVFMCLTQGSITGLDGNAACLLIPGFDRIVDD